MEALKDSGLTSRTENDDIGVFFGCGMPGVSEIYETAPLISNKVSWLNTNKILVTLIFFHIFNN